MTVQIRPPKHNVYTVEDLDAFPESTLIEVIDGALIVNPPPTFEHRSIQTAVMLWLLDGGAPPEHVVMEPGVQFAPAIVLQPDVVRVTATPPSGTVYLNPEDVLLVVEVLSPSSRSYDLGRKRVLYAGAWLTYVIVDPDQQSVIVHDDSYALDVDALKRRLGWL